MGLITQESGFFQQLLLCDTIRTASRGLTIKIPKLPGRYVHVNYKLAFTANSKSFYSKACFKTILHNQLTTVHPNFLK